jgi:hypothetical protein
MLAPKVVDAIAGSILEVDQHARFCCAGTVTILC